MGRICHKHTSQRSEKEPQHTAFLFVASLKTVKKYSFAAAARAEKRSRSPATKNSMLPKGKRMKGLEIALIFSRAKTARSSLFILKYVKNPTTKPSFAIAAAKKVFKTAVERNKVRRRIYSAIRSAKMENIPYSIVIMPNYEAIQAPYKKLVEAIETICKDLK